MARKHDKMRPYRIDYLEISEIESEQVYVRSTVVRAVTAADAKRDHILYHNRAVESLGVPGRIPIRVYRFYEDMSRNGIISKRPTSILKLFSSTKWPEVSSQIVQSLDNAEKSVACPFGYTKDNPGTAHDCLMHSAADYAPTTGPNSPATQAVIADLQGMVDHDSHEQLMDNFVPDSVPAGHQLPDPKNEPFREINLDEAAPVLQSIPMDASTDPANDAVFDCGCEDKTCQALQPKKPVDIRKYALVGGIILILLALGLQYLVAVHK